MSSTNARTAKPLGKYRLPVINSLLRLLPMAAKMVLTLYMGKYFSLEDVGVYGLVLAAVSVASVVFGQNFAYIVNRDIVGVPPDSVLHKIRDQVYLYAANYAVMAIIIAFMLVTHANLATPAILIYTLLLTILEGLGNVAYYNMNSLHQQIPANAMFCLRAGVWVPPVILLCVFKPELRAADTILIAWIMGAAFSLVGTLWYWRDFPWRKVMPLPIDWPWIIQGIKTSGLVWLGLIGLTAGSYVDRFVIEHDLTIEAVGVVTFYFSFTNALLTLMQSGVAAFATPRLIQHHRDGNKEKFHQEARQANRQIAVGGGVVAVGLGIAVPLLAAFLGKSALIAATGTFWLMLIGTWVRANADMLNNILFARHQDRAIWLGNLLFLIPVTGGNLVLVPFLGLPGVGISTILAAALLYIWRWWHMNKHVQQ